MALKMHIGCMRNPRSAKNNEIFAVLEVSGPFLDHLTLVCRLLATPMRIKLHLITLCCICDSGQVTLRWGCT